MPRSDTGVEQNKARLAEAGRGSYPNGTNIFERNIIVDVCTSVHRGNSTHPKMVLGCRRALPVSWGGSYDLRTM